jgi:hypothetical protein
MKALVIKIRDAGVFKAPSISGSQDKVLDIDGYVSRFDKRKRACVPHLKVPAGQICSKHVANLLRVLFGERPVPTLRKVHKFFKGDVYFEELARKVRVKIESPVFPVNPGHKDAYYPEETATIRKSIGDSWKVETRPYFLDGKFVQIKGGLLYHDRLHRYLGNDLYLRFINLVGIFGTYETIQEAIELLNLNKTDSRVVSYCASCKENKRTSLSNMILNSNAASNTIHSAPSGLSILNVLMASGTIQTIEKFNATLYVPVSEEDLRKISEGTGVASFLEGGYAKVECVEDWSDLIELDTIQTVEGEYVCNKDS